MLPYIRPGRLHHLMLMPGMIARAISYINENLSGDLSLPAIARQPITMLTMLVDILRP